MNEKPEYRIDSCFVSTVTDLGTALGHILEGLSKEHPDMTPEQIQAEVRDALHEFTEQYTNRESVARYITELRRQT